MTSDSEAQSEAPSVVDELEKLIPRCKTKDIHDFPDLKDGERCANCELWDTIDAKINRLITEARIDELKQLLGRQWWADDQHHEDEVVPYHHIEAQIKLLSNNLSKRDYNA